MRAFLLGFLVASCTPVSQSYEVHSSEMGCEEANRYVYAAVTDMNMKVTSFTQAQPGRPGRISAVGRDRSGDVRITCDPAGKGVVIDPSQTTMGERTFERGIFLSVTGRSGLRMNEGQITGREKPVGDLAQSVAEGDPAPSGSVLVEVTPQKGFEAVLDFDADLAAAGVLPVRVTIRNGSGRAYSFAIDGVTVRKRDSGEVAARLTPAEAAAKLVAKAGSGGSQTEVGNVESAKKIMLDKELKPARLTAGASVTGYLYYPVGDYDRAKVQMTDVAADEIETFLVEF
jgi:hypothetical protein